MYWYMSDGKYVGDAEMYVLQQKQIPNSVHKF